MMRSGKEARWGNNLGYLILPLLMLKQQNPLDYVRTATAMTRKKRSSLEGPFTYASGKLLMKLAGVKVWKFIHVWIKLLYIAVYYYYLNLGLMMIMADRRPPL